MTQAVVEAVVPDPDEARLFLAQARGFIADAGACDLRATSRQLLYYQGVLAACDAALLWQGYRVQGVDGGHSLRLQKAAEVLGLDEGLLDDLDDARQIRAGSAYRAGLVTDDDLADTEDAAHRLLDAAAELVSSAS